MRCLKNKYYHKTFKPSRLNVLWSLAPIRIGSVVVVLDRLRHAPANTVVGPKPEKRT